MSFPHVLSGNLQATGIDSRLKDCGNDIFAPVVDINLQGGERLRLRSTKYYYLITNGKYTK